MIEFQGPNGVSLQRGLHKMKGLWCSILIAAGCLIAGSLADAQTFRGAIAGTVTDSSGAAVPGAKIQTTNAGTGFIRQTSSNEQGQFSFEDLPVGQYSIGITHPGFETTEVRDVNVAVGGVIQVPVKLEISQQNAVVEVNASAVTLDTETSAANEVIPETAVATSR